MKYTVEVTERFEKEFKRLDRYTQRMLKSWIEKNLVGCENPRAKGKGLTANRSGQWRYRIGDYRLICLIQDNELVILALTAGYRSGANCESRKTKRFAIERGKCGRGEADYLAAACAFSTKTAGKFERTAS